MLGWLPMPDAPTTVPATLTREADAAERPMRLLCVCGDSRVFTGESFVCVCGRTRDVLAGGAVIEGEGIRGAFG